MSSSNEDTPTRVEKVATAGDAEPARQVSSAFATPYEDRGALGRGGMGEVRQCHDVRLGRTVAMKLLHSEYAGNAEMLARFLREARLQGSLEHPAIVPVYDVGLRDGDPFFTMKRVGGQTLKDVLSDLKVGAGATLRYSRRKLLSAFSQVCAAVHYAHVKGVLHRDLKPSNIMFGDFGEVYVLDWGIAGTSTDAAQTFDGSRGGGLTATGAITGTLGYMAPEQLRGEPLDARADVYSLGAMLFAMLALEPLHDDSSQAACEESTLRGVDVDARIEATAPDTPPELVAICRQAVRQERHDRFATALALQDAIERYLDGDRDLAARQTLAREHLARALALFPPGDDEARHTDVMRAASRALALDPHLEGAADLIGRLMLEPPRTTPVAVEKALRADADERTRKIGRVALITSLAMVGFVPGLVAARSVGFTAAACTVFLLYTGFAWRMSRGLNAVRPWIVMVVHGLIIVLVSRLYSFLVVAPALAAMMGGIICHVWGVTVRLSIILWLVLCACVLGPLVAEASGWISPTVDEKDGGLLLHAAGFLSSKAADYAYESGFVLLVIGAAVGAAHVLRRSDDELRRRLQLQAWQLGHLVPRNEIS